MAFLVHSFIIGSIVLSTLVSSLSKWVVHTLLLDCHLKPDMFSELLMGWLLLYWLLHKLKREFSDTNLRLENFADVSTECFHPDDD